MYYTLLNYAIRQERVEEVEHIPGISATSSFLHIVKINRWQVAKMGRLGLEDQGLAVSVTERQLGSEISKNKQVGTMGSWKLAI